MSILDKWTPRRGHPNATQRVVRLSFPATEPPVAPPPLGERFVLPAGETHRPVRSWRQRFVADGRTLATYWYAECACGLRWVIRSRALSSGFEAADDRAAATHAHGKEWVKAADALPRGNDVVTRLG